MRPIIPDFVKGEVRLPASKSISNRVLILDALSGHQVDLQNLSDSDDTRVLRQFLQSPVRRVDVGLAGTAMRFLSAFLAARQGTWELTGSPRMCQRPMAPLVEALNALGARVGYVATPGCPPLRIEGMPLAGGEIEMPASVSSQFVSALMMVAPGMRRGLVLHLAGKVVSAPYIRMTGQVMHEFGIEMDMRPASIRIPPQAYRAPRVFRVEPDWTAASYFYELLAVARDGAVALPGLQPGSLQGDAVQVGLWERLGVRTRWTGYGVCLEKQPFRLEAFAQDFTAMPDLVPSFAVACCLLDVPFVFTGVETLRWKETDRLAALVAELARLGYVLHADESSLRWDGDYCPPSLSPEIHTYGDHRMAMAFAPALCCYPEVTLRQPEVVAKSFPCFWQEWEKICKA